MGCTQGRTGHRRYRGNPWWADGVWGGSIHSRQSKLSEGRICAQGEGAWLRQFHSFKCYSQNMCAGGRRRASSYKHEKKGVRDCKMIGNHCLTPLSRATFFPSPLLFTPGIKMCLHICLSRDIIRGDKSLTGKLRGK